MAGGIGAALDGQRADAAKREKEEKLDSFVGRMLKFGRPGKTVLFDAPGVVPTEYRLEPLDDDDTERAKAGAYAHTVKRLGAELRGRVEDTDIYDQRLVKEYLHYGVKRTDLKVERGEKAGEHYKASASPDDFGKFTNEQLTYWYNQLQIVTAEFQPTRAQRMAMQDIEKFCKACAEAVADGGEGNGFLFLASLSWPESVQLVANLGATLHGFLAPSSTPSDSPSTSESSADNSNGDTTSSIESPLDTSALLSRPEAVEQAIKQSPASSADSPHEPDGEAAARDLVEQLK